MSVEKLDKVKAKEYQIPFTMISTQVIQNIRNAEALAVWVYLSSLPPNWIIQKIQIKKHFRFGDNKLKSIFAYLARANLIQYERERFPDGTLGQVIPHVLCGDIFNLPEPSDGDVTTGLEIKPVVKKVIHKTTGSKTRPLENQTTGFEKL